MPRTRNIGKNKTKTKRLERTFLDAFTNTFGSLQKQLLSVQRHAPTKEKIIVKSLKKLVPKPPGSAGKSNGYNLQDEMGLSRKSKRKTRRYNGYLRSIRALGNSILKERKTWRQQPMLLRCQVIALAQEKHPFLQKFANGWPIADILRQYLLNAKCYAKRVGDDWDADPRDENEVDEDEDDEQEVDEDEDSEQEVDKGDSEDDLEDDLEEVDSDEDEDEAAGYDSGSEEEGNSAMDVDADPEGSFQAKKGCKKSNSGSKAKERAAMRNDSKASTKRSNAPVVCSKGGKANPKAKERAAMGNGVEAQASTKRSSAPPRVRSTGKANPKAKEALAIRNDNEVQAFTKRSNVVVVHSTPNLKAKNPVHNADDGNEHWQPKIKRLMQRGSDTNMVDPETPNSDMTPLALHAQQALHGAKTKSDGTQARNHTLLTCPQEGCDDIIPRNPCPWLKELLWHHEQLIMEGAHETRLSKASFMICQELSNELRMLQVANRYPVVIDFDALPERIEAMAENIETLVCTDLDGLERNFISRRLVKGLVSADAGLTRQEALVKFASQSYYKIPDVIRERARPGYYGPRGYNAICDAIIDWILTISPEVFFPFTPQRFTEFILIPNIACQLIADDRDISQQQAYEIMIDSADVGDALQQVTVDPIRTDGIAQQKTNSAVEKIPSFVASRQKATEEQTVNRHLTGIDGRTISSPKTNAGNQPGVGPSRFVGCYDDKSPEDHRGQQKKRVKKEPTRKSTRFKASGTYK